MGRWKMWKRSWRKNGRSWRRKMGRGLFGWKRRRANGEEEEGEELENADRGLLVSALSNGLDEELFFKK
jgi:hypothetical protein